jgi:metal-responsive CopG/Arc/MetJ family transcriptional regulator
MKEKTEKVEISLPKRMILWIDMTLDDPGCIYEDRSDFITDIIRRHMLGGIKNTV